MRERVWTITLSQVEMFAAVYECLERRGDAPPLGGMDELLLGLRATYDKDGAPIYEFWGEKRREKKPFRLLPKFGRAGK